MAFWPREIWSQSRDVWRYVLVKMTKETLPAIAAVIAIIGWTNMALSILLAAVPLGVLVDLAFYYALRQTTQIGITKTKRLEDG